LILSNESRFLEAGTTSKHRRRREFTHCWVLLGKIEFIENECQEINDLLNH
jgi:hypothetical protein